MAVSACATRPYNAALETTSPVAAYTFANRLPRNSPKLFVVLTFSGGGTRAAAFTLGVLEKLAATKIIVAGESRRLLDEVDVITAVSGGSYTAAYFGLFEDRVFSDFPERFLYRDVHADMITALLSPTQLGKMASSRFNRTDGAA
ncbi:MAG: patatin-like phospholipase family protein [Burkholderiaceae bacterium]|nr:patatin-like phospholipase family protein [Burkholderiaceae bacterium]